MAAFSQKAQIAAFLRGSREKQSVKVPIYAKAAP